MYSIWAEFCRSLCVGRRLLIVLRCCGRAHTFVLLDLQTFINSTVSKYVVNNRYVCIVLSTYPPTYTSQDHINCICNTNGMQFIIQPWYRSVWHHLMNLLCQSRVRNLGDPDKNTQQFSHSEYWSSSESPESFIPLPPLNHHTSIPHPQSPNSTCENN